MDLDSGLQRHIGSYTYEAGINDARRGDHFLGSGRTIRNEMRQCVCGLCVSTEGASQTRCTIFSEGGVKLV